MPEPACQLCRFRLSPQGRRLLRGLRCFCPDGRQHGPVWEHPHVRPGCIGFTPPPVEVVGSVDRWEEAGDATQ